MVRWKHATSRLVQDRSTAFLPNESTSSCCYSYRCSVATPGISADETQGNVQLQGTCVDLWTNIMCTCKDRMTTHPSSPVDDQLRHCGRVRRPVRLPYDVYHEQGGCNIDNGCNSYRCVVCVPMWLPHSRGRRRCERHHGNLRSARQEFSHPPPAAFHDCSYSLPAMRARRTERNGAGVLLVGGALLLGASSTC